MTLAVILFVSSFYAASVLPPMPAASLRQAATQTAPTTNPASPSAPAQDSSAPAKPTAANPAPASKSTSTTAPKPRRKKKPTSNCVTAPASGSTAKTTAPSGDESSAPPAPTVCPPPKIVVRQGGTSEPSIHLAGGAGDQAAHQRDTANQMLAATETNLKKLNGRQLTTSQQDMVNQVHQFMDQSKSAVAAGDTERARTLAWKAQLLSEELINPK
jgi:hypothetical protein